MSAAARGVPFAPKHRVQTHPAKSFGMVLLARDERYSGPPPENLLPLLYRLTIPLPSICFNELDLEREGLHYMLDQIKKSCKVWIVAKNGVDGTMTLWAHEREDFADVLWKIHSLLSLSGDGRGTFFPLFMVQVPSTQPDATKVLLASTSDGKRAVVQENPAADSPSSDEMENLREKHFDKFRKAFDEVAGELKKVPAEMRMRVQFGRLSLTQIHKEKHLYDFKDFETFARQVGRRGCSKMNLNIGDERFAGELLKKVFESTAIFEPEQNRILRMEDTPAHQFIVLFAKGYRIEIPIQTISTGSSQTELNSGSPRGFHQTGRNKEIEITMLCPEKHHDWKMEVLTELTRLPAWADDLISQVQFGPAEGEDQFPTPQIPDHVIHQHDVEMLAGKTIWKVRMIRSSYLVEISLYREWSRVDTKSIEAKITSTKGAKSIKGGKGSSTKGSNPKDINIKSPDPQTFNTKIPPHKFCGVTLYCSDWEDEMRFRNLAEQPRDWGSRHENLFPLADTEAGTTPTGRRKDGYDAFLKKVDDLHKIIDSIDPVNSTGPVSAPEDALMPTQDLLDDIQESIAEQPLESQGAGPA